MSAPDYLNLLRQKNEEKSTPSPNCINRVKYFTQFMQSPPSEKNYFFQKEGGAEISPQKGEETASSWKIITPDRGLTVHYTCPMTFREVMEDYPGANAEPFLDQLLNATRRHVQ
jgi:hypothetical protein